MVFKVENLWVKGDCGEEVVRGVFFEVRVGEIFGIVGVEGNGQSELIEVIFGFRRVEKGRIYFNGVDIIGKSFRDFYDMGFVYILEDRIYMGFVIEMSVMENLIFGMYWRKEFLCGFGFIDWGRVKKYVSEFIEEFEISVFGVNVLVKSLSGGNQQKFIVVREVSKKLEFIIVVQFIRGVDVVLIEYIRNYFVKFRNENKVVFFVLVDFDEVFQLSDRMVIMYEG